MRHMHEFGTTSEQLAWIKVAASQHAQYNEHALLREVVTVEDVVNSPMISDPLHRLDCCVITDGGGALVVVSPEVARSLDRSCVKVLGAGEAVKHADNGRIDLTYTGAVWSGPRAFEEAGVTPGDIDYASIYDSFTITVVMQIEDLGFCKKGEGGRFVADGNLIAGSGKFPFNTDGGGLCNNHPANRGGMTKVIEAVRQLRDVNSEIRRLQNAREDELFVAAKDLQAPFELVRDVAEHGKLPVVNFVAGGISTPADAALVMQLGAEGVFVGSGIFKSEEPARMANAIVQATTFFDDAKKIAEVSKGLGAPMRGIALEEIPEQERLAVRGW
jgi:hypothetical protein